MNPIIFFVIITVILGVYGLVFYTKTKQTKTILALDEQKNAIFQIPNDVLILKLGNMHLSGKTQNLYVNWANQWEMLVKEQLPAIEEQIDQAEQLSNSLKLHKSKQCISATTKLIEETEQKALQIHEALQVIVESESSTHEEIEAVNTYYQNVRNHVLTSGETYGKALPTIQKQLADVDGQIKQFNQLMQEADYLEAKDMLHEVDSSVHALEEKMQQIPALSQTFSQTYAEQLTDLQEGYNQLAKENYRFANVDIQEEIDALSSRLNQGKQAIVDLNIEKAIELQSDIETDIDRLYDVMETEIDAKETVYKVLPRVEAKLQQIVESNQHVSIELDRIQQSYELTDNEVETINTLAQQLVEHEQQFEDVKQGIEAKRFVYSNAKDKLAQLAEVLTTIDKQQADMMKSLSDLKQRERFARDQVETFEFDLRHMKRELERQNLPGLPQLFLDLFFDATKRIEELSQQLNRIKINMKEIDDLVQACTQDVEKLDETTESIIDNAALTEQLVQYANRYRMEYASIDKAITIAVNLYQHQYKYEEAKQTIAQAVDSVDTGASSRVEKLYYDDKHRHIF